MSETAPSVLIVEDEVRLADILHDYFTSEGFAATVLTEGSTAVDQILTLRPDLVVLDILLPGKDGLTICREVRARSDVPIIMATARVEEIDRLLGLDLGADDYVCKPYSPREVVARARAILRRTGADGATEPRAPTIQIDESSWSAAIDGTRIDLTRREFQLLAVMARRPGRVFSRDQLLDLAFPSDTDVFDRTIDSHIKNIRRKIARVAPDREWVRSVYGVGYAFEG